MSPALVAPAAAQDAAASFFAGKQVEFVIGTAAGGGFDTYGRLVARHMGNYIPGKPTLVVKNMPGAASNKAAGYMASVAPKDGTSMAAIFPGAIFGPLLGDKSQFRHDPLKLIYLGSANNETYVCLARSDAAVQTFEDALSNQIVMGATANGSTTHDFPHLLNNALGTKFSIVAGYPGTTEIILALERGEVQGTCGYSLANVFGQKADLLKSGKVRILAQETLKSNPQLDKMGVPTTLSFAKTDDARRVLELVYAQAVLGRPYVLPPDVPAARVDALRAAFDAALADKTLLAEAEKAQIEIQPVSGVDAQALVTSIYNTPESIVERTRKVLAVDSGK